MEKKNSPNEKKEISTSEEKETTTCVEKKDENNTSDEKEEQIASKSEGEKRKRKISESVEEDLTKFDECIAAALEFAQFEVTNEVEIPTDRVLSSIANSLSEKPTFQNLDPVIPSHITRKGKSRANISKGKRPANTKLCTIDGDLLDTLSQFNVKRRIYDLTEESYHNDKVERIRNTLKERIIGLADGKIYTLSELHRVFVNEKIPLSLRLPSRLSTESLSSLLVVEEDSKFIQDIKGSINFQELIRKHMLEEKNIPVCRCGFIYIDPSLTYAKSPNNPNMFVGQLGNMLAFERKENVMEKLNKMRYFLEVLYEYLSS